MLASVANLSGRSLIGFREGAGTGELLYATDPTTGHPRGCHPRGGVRALVELH